LNSYKNNFTETLYVDNVLKENITSQCSKGLRYYCNKVLQGC
jgi:hypothetical protein